MTTSHMWLVAIVLDITGLEIQSSKNFIFGYKKSFKGRKRIRKQDVAMRLNVFIGY